MRAFSFFLIMLLSACAFPTGERSLSSEPSNKPTPRDTVLDLSYKIKGLCEQPEYTVYFAKTFCTPSEINLAMMSNKTKITQSQKVALNAWSQTYDRLATELNESLILISPANKQMAEYNKTIAFPAAQKNRMNLYRGDITWGVYNRKRKEIYDGIATEADRLAQQNI
ncbi:hypothetical protein [Shewanella sp.]|uniref:hypothetical protein n=1 Tax=Shewanella sp. TaxID=50422 RepID=UPI0040479ADA